MREELTVAVNWVFVGLAAAAGWLIGSGETVSAQDEECMYSLFGDRYMSTRTIDRPDVFLLDECSGATWWFNRDRGEWIPLAR